MTSIAVGLKGEFDQKLEENNRKVAGFEPDKITAPLIEQGSEGTKEVGFQNADSGMVCWDVLVEAPTAAEPGWEASTKNT